MCSIYICCMYMTLIVHNNNKQHASFSLFFIIEENYGKQNQHLKWKTSKICSRCTNNAFNSVLFFKFSFIFCLIEFVVIMTESMILFFTVLIIIFFYYCIFIISSLHLNFNWIWMYEWSRVHISSFFSLFFVFNNTHTHTHIHASNIS